MTKSEIMNCAAILAAGIIASPYHRLVYKPVMAVDLMEQIADEITSRQDAEQKVKDEIMYPKI